MLRTLLQNMRGRSTFFSFLHLPSFFFFCRSISDEDYGCLANWRNRRPVTPIQAYTAPPHLVTSQGIGCTVDLPLIDSTPESCFTMACHCHMLLTISPHSFVSPYRINWNSLESFYRCKGCRHSIPGKHPGPNMGGLISWRLFTNTTMPSMCFLPHCLSNLSVLML